MSTEKKMLPAGAVIVRQERKFAEVLRVDTDYDRSGGN